MDFSKDYYAILNVLPTAELVVIRAAYRALAMQYHPDKWRGERSVAEKRMREINEAHEILADEQKRRQYDHTRKKRDAEDFDFESESTRSTFRDAEQADRTDWDVANEYYPDLETLYSKLKRTSFRLAFAFRTTIMENKRYADRQKLAAELENKFLQSYFGTDPEILAFARQLIEKGHGNAAKELNKAISVLGSSVDAGVVISKIIGKFKLFKRDVSALANNLVKTRYIDAAIELVEALGGKISRKMQGGILFGKYIMIIDVLDLHHECETYPELVDWLIRNIIPKIVSGQFYSV